MGIFDFFSRKKKANPADTLMPGETKVVIQYDEKAKETPQVDADYLLERVEVIPGLAIPRAFADRWEDIAHSKATYLEIKAKPATDLSLEQSKFAFYPMLPVGFEYPKDRNGAYMFPLAQFNFREMPHLKGYPKTGYLQFYVGTNVTHGLSLDGKPSDFKVLFFEEQEVEKYQVDFSFLNEILAAENIPVTKPHALTFELKEEYFGLGNVENNMNHGLTVEEIAAWYDHPLEGELLDHLYELNNHEAHKLGGYAYFCQEDPRKNDASIREMNLLFQMKSEDEIMWGDMGAANFFIYYEDLIKKDFSKVIYHWDC
ncbi:MAG: DUF1963 domain-containing protein [Chitinophagaceae bacterium]|nr:DUF1963 domain-containing protein [Chitinophagaceae bacterium]